MEFIKINNGCVDLAGPTDVFRPGDVRAMCDGESVERLLVGQDGWYIVFHIEGGFDIQVFHNHKRVCREAWPEEVCTFVEEVREEWKKHLWEAAKNL